MPTIVNTARIEPRQHVAGHAGTTRVLQAIFDLSAVTGWNGPSQRAIAELILPRTAADLTVRELLELMDEVAAEAALADDQELPI